MKTVEFRRKRDDSGDYESDPSNVPSGEFVSADVARDLLAACECVLDVAEHIGVIKCDTGQAMLLKTMYDRCAKAAAKAKAEEAP
jgi:hypothetical protein